MVLNGGIGSIFGKGGASTSTRTFRVVPRSPWMTQGIATIASANASNLQKQSAVAAAPPDLPATQSTGGGSVVIQFLDAEYLAARDGLAELPIPAALDGMKLTDAEVSIGSGGIPAVSGTPTFQIHNVTRSADMLSTPITIDSGARDSRTAAVRRAISGLNVIYEGDVLRLDCDVSGTGTKGPMFWRLTFSK